MKKLILLLLLLSVQLKMYAQFIPITLEQKLNQSLLVIEGRVVGQKPYMASDGEIYTENQIEVKKLIKGRWEEKALSIITIGGKVNNTEVTWSHLPSLSNNQYGIFFLVSTTMPTISVKNEKFEIYGGEQGFYQILKDETKKLKAYSVIDKFEDLNDFYNRIGVNIKASSSIFEQNMVDKRFCIEYRIVPHIAAKDAIKLGADIEVRVTEGKYSLYKANLKMNYNTNILGESIISSGNLTYDNGEFPTEVYNLTFKDATLNTVEIVLQANTQEFSKLIQLDTEYKKVATVELDIKNWAIQEPFILEGYEGNMENFYLEENGYIKEFECTKLTLGAACDVDITSFSPEKAAGGVGLISENGISGIVTIIGTGFSTPLEGEKIPKDYRVKFRTVEGGLFGWVSPFEGDYISWTDTKIVVKVPSIGYYDNTTNIGIDYNKDNAATGKIRVCKATMLSNCGCSDTSDDNLYIPFSVRNTYQTNKDGNKESVRVLLRNRDENGGYTIYFTQEFKDKATYVAPFKRALSTWRCNSQVNFKISDGNPISFAQPGIGVIGLKNLPISTTSTTRAQTSSNPDDCGSEPNINYSSLPNFSINFNKALEWHTETSTPTIDWTVKGDLESTALHELGHAHLLIHTLNTPNTMISPGPSAYRRTLTDDDKAGGNHISLLSSSSDASDCLGTKMNLINLTDCNVLYNTEQEHLSFNLSLFPNPVNDVLAFDFEYPMPQYCYKVQVIDILGRHLLTEYFNNSKGNINTSNFPAGTYTILYYIDETILVGKFFKL